MTTTESRHIGVWISRPAADVYRYAADPTNLPRWAAGLATSEVTRIGDDWVVCSPMGEVTVRFAPANDFGVLDHVVTASGAEPVFQRRCA